MKTQKTKQTKKIAIVIAAVLLCIAGIFFIAWNANQYFLELSIPNEEITLEYGKDELPEVTALCKGTIFNKKGTKIETEIQGTADLSKLGTYEITYAAKYKNLSLSEKRIFHVVDTTAPEIKLVSNPEHFTSPVGTYEEEGFKAIDNYDGDISDKVEKSEKEGIITYTVTDSSGNTATAERTIIYKDVVVPVITLTDGAEIKFTIGKDFTDPGFTATDDVDGDITKKVTINGKVDGHKAGTYTLTYTVADSSENKCETKRTVTVGDFAAPTLTLSGKTSFYLKIGTAFSEPGFNASDNVDGDITSKVKVSGSVDTGKMGRYTLTYTVTDAAGNTATATRSVLVYKQQAVASTVNPGDKVVYLTFDDGPGKYTQQLLDILDKYNVKATFFVTNQFPSYQNMIGEAYRRGHTIGLHTFSHNYSKIYASETDYFNDLDSIKNICINQTGTTPTLIRFPGGTSNTVSRNYCSGIMTLLSESVSYYGYLYTDWNVDSGDAGGTTSSKQVAQNVISGIQKHSVSNVLQHDIQKHSIDAMEEIIFWGLEHGYTFLPMNPSSPLVQFSPKN